MIAAGIRFTQGDRARATKLLERGCALGDDRACKAIKESPFDM